MVIRNRLRVGRKQVLPGRNITDWKTSDPAELKRQLFDLEKHLGVLVEQNAQLLAIVNGNETPTRIMPERGHLQFRGTAVAITQDSRDTIATIGYEGLDGIDTEQGYIRSSHDRVEFAPAGGSTNHNVNPTGWDTADDLFVTAPSSLATATGFAAPSSDGTLFRKLIVDPDSPGTQFAIGHLTGSDSGNQVYCPGGTTLTLNRGGSALLYHPPGELVWFVVATSGAIVTTSHSALTNLDVPGDHLWALLRDGTRSLQGHWSLGGFNLTNAAAITGTGAVSLSSSSDVLSLYGDDGIQVDAFGSGFNLYAPAMVAFTADGSTYQVNALLVDINAGASGFDLDSVGAISLTTSNGNIVLDANGTGRDVLITADDDIALTAAETVFVTGTGAVAISSDVFIRLSAPSIDADDNPIHNVEFARFINELMTQADASGNNDAFSVAHGVPHAVRSSSYNYVIDFPVHVQYGDAAEGSTQSIAINLTSIAGKDLSNGTVDFYSFLSFQQSGTGDDAYQERCHYSYYRAKSTGSATITSGSDAWGDRQGTWNFGSYSHPNTLTISGTNDEIVTFQITLPGASGTGRLLWFIRATGHGG